MATSGELTVGKLKNFLDGFPDDTKVVLGQQGTGKILKDCWANTYYPPGQNKTWVIIDPGHHELED